VPMEMVALHGYAKSGKPDELLKRYGLTARDIEKAVKSAIKRK
jgi:transketolase C-terminal domain/subunit